MKVFGFAGYSGAGKTTLIENLIPRFVLEGLTVSLIKHALLVLGMLLVVAAGFIAPAAPPATPAAAAGPLSAPALAAFGTALLFVLFTYGGWNEAAYISAEGKGGTRSILKVLVLALALVTVVYLLFVSALLSGLGFDGLKASKAVAADVAARAFGPFGEKLIGAIAALAALTSVNATMIVSARTNYSLGADWPLFSFMNRWNSRRAAPVTAFVVTGALSLAPVTLAVLMMSLRCRVARVPVRLMKIGIAPSGFTIAIRVVNILMYSVHSSMTPTLYRDQALFAANIQGYFCKTTC